MTVYNAAMDQRWRIETLCKHAAYVLQRTQYAGPQSARVREVPDVRTSRYYTTAGLLDRPSEMRGRTAYYGRRHLLQLVAIKRLQAQGLSLAAVQQKLHGATDATLKTLAGVTDDDVEAALAATEHQQPVPAAAETAAPRQRFWEQLPQQTFASPGELSTRPAVILPVGRGASLVLEGMTTERLAKLLPDLEGALQPLRAVLNQPNFGEPNDKQT